MNQQLPVTVSVITYNSSKFVLETLESVKAQTYQPLILHICDDCSTDDTIKICENWIADNKKRFIDTKIIVPEHNTGVAGNLNRALDACKTEWFKGTAGDDILKPNCIEENVCYISEHPEAALVFSRVEVFGPSQERIDSFSKVFDYSFFKMSPVEQYERLVFKGNCLPAATSFLNVYKIRGMEIRADERIPLLEDYPLWLILAKNKVKFHFIDKVLVGYRVGDGGLSTSLSLNICYLESIRKAYYYYVFPEKYSRDPYGVLDEIVAYEMSIQRDMDCILHSFSYRLGHALLKPFVWIVSMFKN